MNLRRAFANILIIAGLATLGVGAWTYAQQSRTLATLTGQETEDGVRLAVTTDQSIEPPPVTSKPTPEVAADPLTPKGDSDAEPPQATGDADADEDGDEATARHPQISSPLLPSFDKPTSEPQSSGAIEVPVDSLQVRARSSREGVDTQEGQKPALSMPNRIVAPAIDLDAEVKPMGWEIVEANGQSAAEWQVPDYAAGWHANSVLPGERGNTVLSGHNNIRGEVFRYLKDFELGDEISLHADDRIYSFVVEEKYIVREKGMPLEVRRRNAQWMMPTEDKRLTLISCWPYTNNTHRIIIVARPSGYGPSVGDTGITE